MIVIIVVVAASVVVVDVLVGTSLGVVGVGAIVCAAPYAYCAIIVNPAAIFATICVAFLPPVLVVLLMM